MDAQARAGSMTTNPGQTVGLPAPPVDRLGPSFLISAHVVLCWTSLAYVTQYYKSILRTGSDADALYATALSITPFALMSVLFSLSQFSFGYFLGFYFYTIILGYLWLIQVSTFPYDHALAYASSFTSALAFLVPALFITAPIKPRPVISPDTFGKLLTSIFIFSSIIVACGAFINLRVVGLSEIYSFRNELHFPKWLDYAMGITSNVLLPFAYACFVAQKHWVRATSTLLLLLLFYPITLSKLALFASAWLLFLSMGSFFFAARTTVVLSLLLPTLLGVILAWLSETNVISFHQFIQYFGSVNFRMIALPSSAFDYYNDFFATHELTYFCQINLVKSVFGCPYHEPLAIVMQNTYQVGNFNASLFATEGIASVGMNMAPVAAFVCGLVIALGNCLSSGLPSRFVLLSAGVLVQTFLNVPLTISFVTNGAALLFLLWYITPRSLFERTSSH